MIFDESIESIFDPHKQELKKILLYIPEDILYMVDETAKKADISRSECVRQALVFAMRHRIDS